MRYWLGFFTILLLGGGSLLTLLIYAHRTKSIPETLVNVILMVLTLFFLGMGLEFYFKVFFAESDAYDTLARQNLRDSYASSANKKQYNSQGFHDIEWTPEMVAGKTKIMIVGDSFVHGDGIADPNKRFSNLLAQKLGPNYVVFNLGKGGTNTAQQIEFIVNYPFSPDILILSYVFNDIQGAMLERQWRQRPSSPQVPQILAPMVNNSYAFNFLYWRIYRLLEAGQPDEKWLWYLDAYNDPDSWWLHKQQLLQIYKGAKSEQIPFLVIVFPSMEYPEKTKVVTDRVIDLFEQQHVPVLDVSELIRGIPARDLMVSPTDPHPSEFANKLVAEALYKMLIAEGIVQEGD